MSLVRAAQLIYTRVEPDYSPQHKGGFQTVYKTASLAPTDVGEIEKRIRCFQSNQSSLVRYQFFALHNQAIVVTYTTPIDSHSIIIDKEHRPGAFIAHCLIMNQGEFEKIDYNPFALLNYYHFLNNAEDMVSSLGQATGVMPSAEIKVERPRYAPASNWSGIEARRLITLSMRAEEILKKGQSVLMVGGPQDISEALQVTFFLMPKTQRLTCTFDTYIDRCPTRPGLYWAVGLPTRQSSSAYIQVNSAERRVADQVEVFSNDKDLYLKWLTWASSHKDFDTVLQLSFSVQMIARAFTERKLLPPNELDDDACREFMALHEESVMQSLETVLGQLVSKNAAKLLGRYLREISPVSQVISVAASQQLNLAKLSNIIVDWLVKENPNLNDNEWKSLRDVARKSQNMGLLHLSATLQKVDTKVRDEALNSMDEPTFRRALEQLLQPIPPADFVTPSYLHLLLSDKRLEQISTEQFVDLVEAILKVDATPQLENLTGQVELLEQKYLARLEKMIKKQPGIPNKFKKAVQARREELGPSPRRFGLL